MLFLVLFAALIAEAGTSSQGNLAVSTKAIDLSSNIKTYTVNCTLHVSNIGNNIQFLRILENGSQLDTVKLNNFTISYTVHLNQSHIKCCEKRYTCEHFGAKIDKQVVTLGERPSTINPEQFKCISENLSYLHCQFPANQDPCPGGTSYSLLVLNSKSFESCKLTKVNDLLRFDSRDQSCQYPVDEDAIEFQLKATSQFGSVTQTIRVHHYDIVRPAAPYNMDVSFSKERKQWFVSWKSKKNLNYFGRKFEYNLQCMKNHTITYDETRIESIMIKMWLMEKLWCREPMVRLRVIPENPNQTALWSDRGVFDPKSKGSTTRSGHGTKLSDEPTEERVSGVFNYIENSDQIMTIEVFWQRNSTWNESNVVAISETGKSYKTAWIYLRPTFGRAKFNLKHDKYNITLEGSQFGETSLPVQPVMAHYQPKFKKLLNNNKSFEVSWFPPDNQNDLKGYTVMYCHLTATSVCEESVVFQKLPSTDTSFNIYSEKTLNFAVSAEYPNYTSSLVWQQCIISPTSSTHNKSPKFHFFDVFSNSLKLRLEPSCEDRSLYELMQIHVIDTTSSKTVKSATYQPHESVVEIPDLAADTSYEVLVVAYNESNVPHEARARVCTKKAASNDQLSIYIVTGVVLLIAMISSTYRITVRIRAIMNIEVEFPFGLLEIDEEPVQICVEDETVHKDEQSRNCVTIGQKQTDLDVIQEEDMGDELACGRCGVTPSTLVDYEEIGQQQVNGYLSVDVLMKSGI